jgi:hypothetical protein
MQRALLAAARCVLRAATCELRGLAGTVTGGALGVAAASAAASAAAASVLILDWPRQAPVILWLVPVAAWTSEEGVPSRFPCDCELVAES